MADRITQLKSMLEKDPNDSFCLYGLGMEYAKLGQHREAAAWFDRAIQSDPDHSYTYFHKARSQQAAGNLAEAAETLKIGMRRAKKVGDAKAAGEIGSYLDELDATAEEEPVIDERMERPI